MSRITLANAVQSLRPGVPFVLRGDDIGGIEWHIDGVQPVTQVEAEAEMARLEQVAADEAAAATAARDAALAKLEALGLTPDDLAALIG